MFCTRRGSPPAPPCCKACGFGREGDVDELRRRPVFRFAALVIRRRALCDLLRRDLAVRRREGQQLMADVLDRRGLMALDVTGFGADHALDRRERRRDHDEIRLRRAGEEPDGRLRLPGQPPNDALRPRAPIVRAVARMALLCGLLQYLPHARMCGAVIIIVESDHENASFSVSWQGHARFFAGQNDVWRCYPRRWASAHLPRLPCQPPFILREKLRRTFW